MRLLAHDLDFWLLPITEVIHDLLRELPAEDDSPLLGCEFTFIVLRFVGSVAPRAGGGSLRGAGW